MLDGSVCGLLLSNVHIQGPVISSKDLGGRVRRRRGGGGRGGGRKMYVESFWDLKPSSL